MIIFSTANLVSIKSIFTSLPFSLPRFALFSAKSPSVIERSVSQENAFKKSKDPSPFFTKLLAQIIVLLSFETVSVFVFVLFLDSEVCTL